MVAVAYRRWSFTRGSNCKVLTGKILMSWTGGHLREVVAHGSEVRLYFEEVHATISKGIVDGFEFTVL